MHVYGNATDSVRCDGNRVVIPTLTMEMSMYVLHDCQNQQAERVLALTN